MNDPDGIAGRGLLLLVGGFQDIVYAVGLAPPKGASLKELDRVQ